MGAARPRPTPPLTAATGRTRRLKIVSRPTRQYLSSIVFVGRTRAAARRTGTQRSCGLHRRDKESAFPTRFATRPDRRRAATLPHGRCGTATAQRPASLTVAVPAPFSCRAISVFRAETATYPPIGNARLAKRPTQTYVKLIDFGQMTGPLPVLSRVDVQQAPSFDPSGQERPCSTLLYAFYDED